MATPRKSRRKARGDKGETIYRLSPLGFNFLLLGRSEEDRRKICDVFATFPERAKAGAPNKWAKLPAFVGREMAVHSLTEADALRSLFETKGGGFHYEKTLTFKQFQRAYRDAKRDHEHLIKKARAEMDALIAEETRDENVA